MLNEMMMAGGMAMAWLVMPAVLLPFLYLYLLQDLAGRRDGTRDPNLGSQVLVTCLMTLGAQLAVVGAALVASSIPADHGDDIRKTGLGLILGGLIAGAFPAYIYFTRVRVEGTGRIAHKALGLNAALFGLSFTILATIVSVAIFHDQDIGEMLAMAIVFLAATVGTILRLTKNPLPTAQTRSPQ